MITTTKEGRGYIRRRLLFVAVRRGFPWRVTERTVLL
jgi:hypothetical protein